jgi:hypothetical protein
MVDTVPPPTFGPQGFLAPSEKDDVLPAVKSDIDVILGGGLNMDDTTPQGQLAVSLAAIIGNANDTFVNYTQQVDPAYADGRMQDAIARIYFIERIGAQATIVTATCVGEVGVVIPAGSIAAADDGTLYFSASDATIGSNGTVDVQFLCQILGPIACPAGTLTTIYRAISGWDSVTNAADGVLGRNTETRAEFEERRRLSVAQNANGSLPAILGAVLNVSGVLDAFAYDNVQNTVQVVGGVSIGPNSVYVAAVGGTDDDVAQAIWSRKSPGCGYSGNTTVTVYDKNPAYNPPYPAYSVTFQRPTSMPTLFAVNIAGGPLVPADAEAQIQNAIISAFAGADGGSRARIGSTIYASRYYATIALLGPWVQIINVKLGCQNNASARFNGTISGTTLTVNSLTSGALAVGQTVLGSGVLDGTVILSGSGSTWTVSKTQSAGPTTMYGCLATLDDVTPRLDQVPSISADNIVVSVS